MGKRRRPKNLNGIEGESKDSPSVNNNKLKNGKKRSLSQNPQEKEIKTNPDIVPRKRKKRNQQVVTSTTEIQEELDPKKPIIETEPSIRAKKKEKRTNIKEQEKLKHVLDMQQQCLNYLSLWKHNREAWKFQKLKQVWIYNNIFDDAKIPEKFFMTAIEYFNNGKGNLKEKLMEQASKIIDGQGKQDEEKNDKNEEKTEDEGDENDDEDDDETDDKDDDEKEEKTEDDNVECASVKFQRARTIMQNMN